jgi:hypothetical protein
MTKKDYELIAFILKVDRLVVNKEVDPLDLIAQQHEFYSEGFADRLQADNPKFDRRRFLAACGVSE